MPNMSYCRFQNTLLDLRDCWDNLEISEHLNQDEKQARIELIELCCEIATEIGSEVGINLEEV